jgi:solute carrier family 25, member 38
MFQCPVLPFLNRSGGILRLGTFRQIRVAGGLSRALATTVLCPITLVKTRLEATGAFALTGAHNIITVTRDIVRENGVRGLWRGCVPTVMSNAPFSAIYYSVYSHIRNNYASADRPQVAVNLVAGVAAAMIATLATQPMDVLRSRIHLGAATSMLSSATGTIKSGPVAQMLLTGAMPRFLKRSLQTALVWTVYEELLPVIRDAFVRNK